MRFDSFPRSSQQSFLGGTLVAAGALGAAWATDARRRNRERQRLHRTMVDLLLNTITAGDVATARHSRRVANLTDALAEELGMPRAERTTLRVASLLHDMGKIDDRFFDVIHSHGPLTPEQRRKIRRHPHESADILAPLEKIHPGLREIVSSHHECWDGSGYPNCLAGEQIPLSARLITVADVFDALSQPRTYRDPLPPEEVLCLLREGAGTHFDPGVVALLDRPHVWNRWLEIARDDHEEEREVQRDPHRVKDREQERRAAR